LNNYGKPPKDPDFHREVYRESGDQIRNINNVRNTYRAVAVVGIAAIISLQAQIQVKPIAIYSGIIVILGIGLVFTLISIPYIRKAINRQRDITWTVMSDWWITKLQIGPPIPLPWFFRAQRSLWDRRLDAFDLIMYIGGIIAALVFAIAGIEVFNNQVAP